jgi:CubicO group peptidase (beta-lactamase class C family)
MPKKLKIMLKNIIRFALVLLFQCLACTPEDNITPTKLYFPPKNTTIWETTTPASLGWNTTQIPQLLTFLEDNNTRGFIVLKNGKIVMEHYFGQNLGGGTFTQSNNWYWASAGKTLTGVLIGIAQQENHLQIQDKTSDYLGNGWSSLTLAQESQITILNQLTMTTGLNDGVPDKDCTDAACLTYLTVPQSRWAYHNAPYTILDKVIEEATHQNFDTYFNTKLRDKIGMDGFWAYIDFNHVYFSTPRAMARFGLLLLNKGKWDNEPVLSNTEYYTAMTNTSQNLNLSYGYLTWLNGKTSFMIPTLQTIFTGSISPNAPADLIAAIGRDGQLVNIVPGQNLVVIRVGDAPDNALVPVTFQNDLWAKLKLVITD